MTYESQCVFEVEEMWHGTPGARRGAELFTFKVIAN